MGRLSEHTGGICVCHMGTGDIIETCDTWVNLWAEVVCVAGSWGYNVNM